MDIISLSLIVFIFLLLIILLWTRKNEVKNQRTVILSVLILILLVLLVLVISDLKYIYLGKSSKEQFGGGNVKVSKRQKLMSVCGMPQNDYATSHCFNDSTHHTCCMLGPKARKYADSSGNPIGKAAKKAFKKFKGRKAKKSDLTPWCTCFGSEVCSFYANKFNDGTHIKLINDPLSKTNIANKPSPQCEGYFRDKFNVGAHGTPGVNKVKNVNKSCSSEDFKIKNIFKM